MKSLVDMPLSPEMAAWLRAEGHEAVHASGVGMSQSPDAEILRVALGEDRVVITADLDFPRLGEAAAVNHTRSKASNVRSLSPKPAKINACENAFGATAAASFSASLAARP